MNQINIQYYQTIIGELMLASFDNKLCMLDYKNRKTRNTLDNRLKKNLKAEYVEQDNEILQQTRKQIDEYLLGQRQLFDIPLLMIGTDFQKRVWKALQAIPFGTTTSYLTLAKNIQNEKAVRAVANANGANAMSLIIPCHRIIGSNGALVGYAGGLKAKQRLLDIEQGNF